MPALRLIRPKDHGDLNECRLLDALGVLATGDMGPGSKSGARTTYRGRKIRLRPGRKKNRRGP